MGRNLDSTLSSHLVDGVIQPIVLVQLTLRSGVENVWSGVGDLVWNGITFTGVGDLGRIGTITEASDVRAEGTTVTLSGIGLSQLDVPTLGGTPPSPPFTPPTGQSVAWALARQNIPVSATFSDPPTVFNSFLGCSGSVTTTSTTGNLGIINGDTIDTNRVDAEWFDFMLPPEIPPGATITGVYPVAVVDLPSTSVNPGFVDINYTSPGGPGTIGVALGPNYGVNIGSLSGAAIHALAEQSVPGPGNTPLLVGFVGMAVYYIGTPLSKTTLIYEALNDVRIGGPAKIWFGLFSNGALLGTPYLAFSGTVDKPTVNTSATSSSITLALENRLINLQRANQRRYTAADQHLAYPTDMAFNWVEALNDQSLKEGTS